MTDKIGEKKGYSFTVKRRDKMGGKKDESLFFGA